MNVEALVERVFQGRNVGHVRQDAQFDLAIVGADQDIALIGDESFADLAAFFRPHRDILQVRIGG